MLVSVDASQLEWRVALELSRDETGINEVLNGIDFHSLNQKTFGLPDRLIAKIYLFRTIFNRGKGYAFTVDPNFMHVSTSVKYWDDIGQKFYTKYNGLNKWHLELGQQVVNGKVLESPLGLFWDIKMGTKYDEYAIPWTILTNYPVQGTAAAVMAIARVSLYNRLKKANLLDICKLVSTVHDSITIDAPTQQVPVVVDLFNGVFDSLIINIRKQFGYQWIVPLTCEVKVGENMKDMVKL